MDVAVRLAVLEDLQSIVALHRQLNPDDVETSRERVAAVFEEILASPYFEFVVVERDGEVVATCYLNIVPNLTRSASPYAIVENVVVAEALRNQGLGKAVVGYALERAWAQGCYKAMLQTGSKSPAKHAFYRACGFGRDKIGFVARP